MTAPNSSSYPDYLAKLIDKCNNSHYQSIAKKSLLVLIILLCQKKLR